MVSSKSKPPSKIYFKRSHNSSARQEILFNTYRTPTKICNNSLFPSSMTTKCERPIERSGNPKSSHRRPSKKPVSMRSPSHITPATSVAKMLTMHNLIASWRRQVVVNRFPSSSMWWHAKLKSNNWRSCHRTRRWAWQTARNSVRRNLLCREGLLSKFRNTKLRRANQKELTTRKSRTSDLMFACV